MRWRGSAAGLPVSLLMHLSSHLARFLLFLSRALLTNSTMTDSSVMSGPFRKQLAAIAAASRGGRPAWPAAAIERRKRRRLARGFVEPPFRRACMPPNRQRRCVGPACRRRRCRQCPQILRRATDSEMADRSSLGGGRERLLVLPSSSSHCGASAKGRGRSSHASGCHTMIEPPSARVSTPSAIRPAELRRPSTCRKKQVQAAPSVSSAGAFSGK